MPYTSFKNLKQYSAGNSVFKYLLASDVHIGSKAHDARLLHSEFSRAVEDGAEIIIGGDTLEMIMSGDRKRYHPAADMYNSDTYINDTIDHCVSELSLYCNHIRYIGIGNHETSVLKYHNIDPMPIIIYQLNAIRDKSLPPIEYTQYAGFIRFQYEHKAGGARVSQTMYHTHGSGGSAEVTKGMINMQRAMMRADADVYWHQHLHTKFVLPDEQRLYMTPSGEVSSKRVMGIQTGAYVKVGGQAKDKYVLDYGVERMRGNQSTGGVMMIHEVSSSGIVTRFIV